jgi:LPXTG-motif cell wall-anchored protein
VLALAVVGFDWLENHAVATLLRADPTTLDAATVAEAARWSVLKSVATTLAGLALLAGGIAALLRRRRAR